MNKIQYPQNKQTHKHDTIQQNKKTNHNIDNCIHKDITKHMQINNIKQQRNTNKQTPMPSTNNNNDTTQHNNITDTTIKHKSKINT